MTYATKLDEVGTHPVAVVEIDLDECTRTFASSPCQASLITTDTAQAGAATTITLATGASASDDFYNNMYIYIESGTGSGQERTISDYVGSTKVATVSSAWGTNPDATSVYRIHDPTVANACYKTRASCQDPDNYATSAKTYRFVERREGLPAGIDMIPSVVGIALAPTRITQDFGLGYRAKVTVTFQDHPHSDRGIDPHLSQRTYDPESQGTYWGRLKARTPYYQGRPFRIRTGFVTDPWDWANFQTRAYVIEEIKGPDNHGIVQVIAKDILKLADDERSKCPVASSGILAADISVSDTSMSIVGGTYNDPSVTSQREWVRIGDEIIEYTAISGTGTSADPWILTGLVRTDITWGSENSTHSTDDSVQLCKAWQSVNVRDIIDELLVTYAGIDATYIPDADWDTEEAAQLSQVNLTTIISEPTGVDELVAELQEQGYLDIWWDEIAQEVKLKAIAPPTSNIATVLDDDSHIIADSLSAKDKAKERVSQVWIYYDKDDYTQDEIGNFKKLYIAADSDAESAAQYGDSRIKQIKSRWFDQNNTAVASQTASRYLARRRNIPQEIRFSLDAKDAVNTSTGDVRDLEDDHLQNFDGSVKSTRVRIIEKKETVAGHLYEYIGITGLGNLRYGFVGPNSLNDYTAESDTNKGKYAFVTNNSGKMSNGDDGYYIQ